MILKRVGVLSVGKIMGCVYAVLGLIGGGFFALFSMIGLTFGGPDAKLPGLLFGVGAIVFLPVLYGVLGFILGLIVAALYNVFAKLVGGIELELEQPKEQPWNAYPAQP